VAEASQEGPTLAAVDPSIPLAVSLLGRKYPDVLTEKYTLGQVGAVCMAAQWFVVGRGMGGQRLGSHYRPRSRHAARPRAASVPASVPVRREVAVTSSIHTPCPE
jgi:hypothetical protein